MNYDFEILVYILAAEGGLILFFGTLIAAVRINKAKAVEAILSRSFFFILLMFTLTTGLEIREIVAETKMLVEKKTRAKVSVMVESLTPIKKDGEVSYRGYTLEYQLHNKDTVLVRRKLL